MHLSTAEATGTIQRTMNKMGYTIRELTKYSQAFVHYARHTQAPTLDIGAAFGVATIPALRSGAQVIANDLDDDHLQTIAGNVTPEERERLQLVKGRFPYDLDFEDNSLGAIHASQVLPFLPGAELLEGIQKMFRWLKPGGRVFIIVSTPFIDMLKSFIPHYLERKSADLPWPGEIEDVASYITHPCVKYLPKFMHFLDDDVLKGLLRSAGFEIENVELFDRGQMPDHIQLDGRENVGIMARKPITTDKWSVMRGALGHLTDYISSRTQAPAVARPGEQAPSFESMPKDRPRLRKLVSSIWRRGSRRAFNHSATQAA